MINAELARVFARIADLLQIDGADRFRINSYQRASRTVKDATRDVRELAAQGNLTELPGIGKGTAERINQYLETGHVDVLDELEARLPAGLPDLLEIPGMGPKKVTLAYRQLGVGSIDALKNVIASGELAKLPGLGGASVKKIADGIAFLESRGGRTRLGEAMQVAQAIAGSVRTLPGVNRVEIAGSIRRGKETIGDVDILCDAEDGESVIKQFTSSEMVKRVLASGGTKGSITVGLDTGREFQIDLRVVSTDSFGAALQYFTGSKEHNVRLRELALKRKLRLSEYGLFDGERRIAGSSEEEVYRALGLPWIPPELRETGGEFEPGARFEDLVTDGDILGDLHMHTLASDGTDTIEAMSEAAGELGYEYIAICDHSRSSTIANGLSLERMEEHLDAIRAANKRARHVEILTGCECDILPDGSMDYPDDLLARCDVVVGSIHSAMGRGGSGKLSPTDRTLAAMENPYVTIIGHPTGRLIHKRPPMELDMSAVIAVAKRTNTILEVNASWQRLDLKDLHVRQALESGVTLAINTDAHRADGLRAMRFGLLTARRGGAAKRDILNCLPLRDLRKRLGAKRNRGSNSVQNPQRKRRVGGRESEPEA